MHHYQAWLTIHVVGSLGSTRGQWHVFFFPPYHGKHEFWAALSHLPWSLMIRVNSWQHVWMVWKGERRKERRRKSFQTVVRRLSQKCNMIYSGICKSNNHSALFTKGTCWFRVWKGGRERHNFNYKSQPTVHALRQAPAYNSVVFLRIRKWRVSDNFSVVSQLKYL